MRRLRAGLCLVLSLLTTALPSLALEIETLPATDAPIVRLEIPSLPIALPLEAGILPNAPAPLNLTPPAAAVAATAPPAAEPLKAAAFARARPTVLARVQSIAAAAAATRKADDGARSAEVSRFWTGAAASKSESSPVVAPAPAAKSTLLSRPRRWATAAVAAAVPSLGFAKTAAASGAPAAPALHAVPPAVLQFLHAHGRYAAFGASVVGLWVADRAVVFGVDRLAKALKTKETTRVALTFAARALVWVGGGVAAANAVGISTTALVTAFGLGSVGVTMAVKDFIGNTIEGSKVFVNQPFVIGDKVQIGGNQYQVTGMDLSYLYINRDGRASPNFRPWTEVSASTIKVFRPYTTRHKTRLRFPAGAGGFLGAALKAPLLMWRATKEMPRPNLRRASVWLGVGVGLLVGLPRLKEFALAALPSHLHALAAPAAYAASGLAAAGVAYLGYRAAKLIDALTDAAGKSRNWHPLFVKAAKVAVGLAAAAGVVLGLVWGLPILHTLVAFSFANNLAAVAGGLTGVFSWLEAGAIMAATRSAVKWVDALIDHWAAKFQINPQMATVIKLAAEVVTYLIGGSLALHQIGMTLSSLFATLGASSAAIGWAASDVLGNLTHGIWLLWRKPFEIGDWLEVDGQVGQVKDMTVQYVVLSAEDGTHVLVPQSVMRKGFTPLRSPEDVAKAQALAADTAAQADFVADLYRKSKAK